MAHLSDPISASRQDAGATADQQQHRDAVEDIAAEQSRSRLAQLSRYGALLVAWVATCGSLFFSEVLGWLPCVLCWYQRILMYPLAIIIAVGILRNDRRIHTYVLPLSLFGALISLYHYLLGKTNWLPPPPCVAGIPCTIEYINWWGFITIPFLALTAFLLISFMMAISSTMSKPVAWEDVEDDDVEPVQLGWESHPAVAPLGVFGIICAVIASFIVAARLI